MKNILILLTFIFSFDLNAQVISTFPYHETFESGGDAATEIFPDGWTKESFGTNDPFNLGRVMHMNISGTDTKGILMPGISDRVYDEWIYTPPIQFEPGEYKISFAYRTGNAFGIPMSLHVGSDSTMSAMDLNPLWQIDEINNDVFVDAEIVYEVVETEIVHFAIRATAEIGLIINFSQNVVADFRISKVDITSANDIEKNKNVRIAPNPANDFFELYIDGFDSFSIKNYSLLIYDLNGREIISQKNLSNINRFATHTLNSGIYIARILDETTGKTVSKKLSIVK